MDLSKFKNRFVKRRVTVNPYSGNLILKEKGYKPMFFHENHEDQLKRVIEARDRLMAKKRYPKLGEGVL